MLKTNITARALIVLVWMLSWLGNSMPVAQTSNTLRARTLIQQSMNKSSASPVRKVLVKSPRDINRSDSGVSFPVKAGVTYRVKVEFKDKDGNTFPSNRFRIRKVFLYQWSGNNAQDCSRNPCWSNLKQFSSLSTSQQEDVSADVNTKWLISSWHTGFPNGMTLQVDYHDCPSLNCWKVEEFIENKRKGLRFVFRYEPPDANQQTIRGEKLSASVPGTTIITIIPVT